MNLEAMNEQERLFENMGKLALFDHIESAIKFADLHYPDEFFLERRRQITRSLNARPQHLRGVNILDHDVSEKNTRTTHSTEKLHPLEKEKEKEKERESETKKCDTEVRLPVPRRVPNKSCRVGSEEVNIAKAAEVGIVTGKFSEKGSERKITEKTRVMIKGDKSSDLEVKFEATKRKLHEAYKRCAKKKTRMIELKDLPRADVRSNKGRPKKNLSQYQ